MTNEKKQTLDTIVKVFKKAAEQLNMELEFNDYEKFIEENPDADQIDIKMKVHQPIPKYITIEFNVDKYE